MRWAGHEWVGQSLLLAMQDPQRAAELARPYPCLKHLGAALRAYLWPAQSVQSRPKLPRQTAASLSIRPGVRLRSTDDDPDVRHRLRQARYACPALAPCPPCSTRARSVQHRRFGHLFTPSC